MNEKKYSFDFTEAEIMLLIASISISRKKIEKMEMDILANRLHQKLCYRIDKIYGLSKEVK